MVLVMGILLSLAKLTNMASRIFAVVVDCGIP